MADTYTGEFYCVKCKAKRNATGEIKVNDKGTRMAKATCPECGGEKTKRQLSIFYATNTGSGQNTGSTGQPEKQSVDCVLITPDNAAKVNNFAVAS